jgi:ADP-heptose:LPS heptosyltransferase
MSGKRNRSEVAAKLTRIVEPAVRSTWLPLVAAALPHQTRPGPPDWATRRHRVLFIRYERIGDMIMATSLIRAIATSHSTIAVDVLASSRNAPVLEHNPYVNSILVLDRAAVGEYVNALRTIRRNHYDAVVDGRINTPRLLITTSLVALASRAPYRVGWSNGTGRRLYNVPVAGTYMEDGPVHYIDASACLAAPFGVEVDSFDWRPEIFLEPHERAAAEEKWPSAARAPRLLVNISAPDTRRRWPDTSFVEAIRAAKEARPGLSVGVIGLPSDSGSVRAVAGATGAAALPTATVRDAFAAVASATFVVTPDTSISHAASAFSKPAVVLLRRDAASYGPYRVPGRVILWEGESIDRVPASLVAEAVQDLVRNHSRV